MKKSLRVARKFGIGIVGIPLLLVGLILIPLPGPGLLVSLLALIVLSTEFDWAQRYQLKARLELKKVYEKAKERKDESSDEK